MSRTQRIRLAVWNAGRNVANKEMQVKKTVQDQHITPLLIRQVGKRAQIPGLQLIGSEKSGILMKKQVENQADQNKHQVADSVHKRKTLLGLNLRAPKHETAHT